MITGGTKRPWWGPAISLALAILACAVLGVLVVTVGSGATEESRAFRSTPRFVVWAALMATQVASWPVLWRVGQDRLRELARYCPGGLRRSEVARIAVLAALLLASWLPPQLTDRVEVHGLWHHGARVGIVLFGGFAAAVPCLLAIWRTHEALAPDVTDVASARETFPRLNPLRAILTSALTAVGVLVTLATLTTGALRGALNEVRPDRAREFPPEYVFLYGAMFTLLLAAAAAPTYGRMRRRATAVVDALLPVVTPPDDGWRERLAQRKDLAAYVSADATLMQGLQAGVLVAGPLLSGLLSLLVPTK